MTKRAARRIVRYDTKLSVDEVRARIQGAIEPPGLFARVRRQLREPAMSDFYGVVDRGTFWIRSRRPRAWTTVVGRIDQGDAGSVVSVESNEPRVSWFISAVIVVYVLSLGGASLMYGGLPPGDAVLGAGIVALFGVVIGVLGRRGALHEREQIEGLLAQMLKCPGFEVPQAS